MADVFVFVLKSPVVKKCSGYQENLKKKKKTYIFKMFKCKCENIYFTPYNTDSDAVMFANTDHMLQPVD